PPLHSAPPCRGIPMPIRPLRCCRCALTCLAAPCLARPSHSLPSALLSWAIAPRSGPLRPGALAERHIADAVRFGPFPWHCCPLHRIATTVRCIALPPLSAASHCHH